MRQLAVLHVDAGGCGGCGLECELVDVRRCGMIPTTEPRHADILLISGTVGRSMIPPLVAVWTAMAEPKWLVALGDCAIGTGIWTENYAVGVGIRACLPVALAIPGSPPDPDVILGSLATLVSTILSPSSKAL